MDHIKSVGNVEPNKHRDSDLFASKTRSGYLTFDMVIEELIKLGRLLETLFFIIKLIQGQRTESQPI